MNCFLSRVASYSLSFWIPPSLVRIWARSGSRVSAYSGPFSGCLNTEQPRARASGLWLASVPVASGSPGSAGSFLRALTVFTNSIVLSKSDDGLIDTLGLGPEQKIHDASLSSFPVLQDGNSHHVLKLLLLLPGQQIRLPWTPTSDQKIQALFQDPAVAEHLQRDLGGTVACCTGQLHRHDHGDVLVLGQLLQALADGACALIRISPRHTEQPQVVDNDA